MSSRERSIREDLLEKIGQDRVRAAWFSTYTFDSGFFERDILDGILVPSAQKDRSQFPVTVVLDPDNLNENCFGYDIARCSEPNRLWHAKAICLMVEGNTGQRTICAIGSGNLTPSGWNSNLELFLSLEWDEWRLPAAIERLVTIQLLSPQRTSFKEWFFEHKSHRRLTPTIQKRIISSLHKPIWEIWSWDAYNSWDEAIVVSPFMDCIEDKEGRQWDIDHGFFQKMLDCATKENKPSLTLYLRDSGKKDGSVFAPWKSICWLENHFTLKILRVEGRPLHAKLFLIKCDNRWYLLGGSPNASGVAMTRHNQNVELAWQQFGCKKLDALELIESNSTFRNARRVPLKENYFIAPIYPKYKPCWQKLIAVKFDPVKQILSGTWKERTPTLKLKFLWDGKQVQLEKSLSWIGNSRTVCQRPLSYADKQKYCIWLDSN